MHDIATISRLNQEAVNNSVKTAQDAGLFVVAKYTGLTLASTYTFDNSDAAKVFIDNNENEAIPGDRYQLFYPTPNPVGRRDQSEDRNYA